MNLFKRILAGILMLALLAFPVLIYFKAQALTDWWQLRGYNPPTDIANLAANDTMTAYTKHMFYLNHPQLVSGVPNFRTDCPDSKQTIVLGCYHSDQNGIFIYSVQDPELYGIEQVTAAHEVLHAIYARLSTAARNQLNGELEAYYKNDLHDPRVLAEVQLYQQTEPNDVMDEMSCTFGTEIASLPLALENYYKPFFSNRQAVVAYENRYEAEFTNRENQIKSDDAQLAQLKNQINTEEQSLDAQLSQITADRATLDNLRTSGQTSQYNSEVASFNAEVNGYNDGVDRLRSDINTYNQLVTSRNSIASALASLDQAIDTRLTPQTTQ